MWPSSRAIPGTSSTVSENATPTATAGHISRLVVQPNAPGQRDELRHAKALATWAATTAMNAAPEAAARAWPAGKSSPGLHPAAANETRKATIDRPASSGPSRANALRSTVVLRRRPETGGPSRRWAAGGSAPRATADSVSVPTSRARICNTPRARGKRPPESAHTRNGVSSATLSVR